MVVPRTQDIVLVLLEYTEFLTVRELRALFMIPAMERILERHDDSSVRGREEVEARRKVPWDNSGARAAPSVSHLPLSLNIIYESFVMITAHMHAESHGSRVLLTVS